MTKITDQSGHSATVAQTQGPSGYCVRRCRKDLGGVKRTQRSSFSLCPQLLNVFKIKGLLTLVAENFFSEMSAGSYDMPLQLHFDFRLSRALKEHFNEGDVQNKILLFHECKITLPKSADRLKIFRPTKDVPTLISTSVQDSGAANERLADKAWSKCSTENSKKREYKGQPRYSACQSLFN